MQSGGSSNGRAIAAGEAADILPPLSITPPSQTVCRRMAETGVGQALVLVRPQRESAVDPARLHGRGEKGEKGRDGVAKMGERGMILGFTNFG